jgi:hypothetical protein
MSCPSQHLVHDQPFECNASLSIILRIFPDRQVGFVPFFRTEPKRSYILVQVMKGLL